MVRSELSPPPSQPADPIDMRSIRFPLWQALAAFVAVGMFLQLSWQIPEVYYRIDALAAGGMLLIFGGVAGAIASHSRSTQRAVRLLAFFFFLVLGVQWASSFRDDYLIWALRWLCVGLLGGTLLRQPDGDEYESDGEFDDDESVSEVNSASDINSLP